MTRKSCAIIDDRNYVVVCAAIRYGNLTAKQADAKARSIVEEWAVCGIRRTAKIFYNPDGSLVKEIGYSDLYPPTEV